MASIHGIPMDSSAMRVRLPYICEDRDRYGSVRCYVRAPGRPKVRMRDMPGSPQFMDAYAKAVAEVPSGPPAPRRLARGSFGYLCNLYFASHAFVALNKSTQNWRRRVLLDVCEQHAEKPVALIQPRHIKNLRDEKRAKPVVANLRLKGLRALFRWAFEQDEVEADPAREVRLLQHQSEGHHTWTDEEIRQYEIDHCSQSFVGG